MCATCAQTKPFGDPEFLAREDVQSHIANLAARIASPTPLRPSDDPDNWDWRAYLAQRKALRSADPQSASGAGTPGPRP